MNRREMLQSFGAGVAIGHIASRAAGPAVLGASPAVASTRTNLGLAAAIEAHRASVQRDEALYDTDGHPLVSLDALDASDEAMAAAFTAMVAVPCRSMQDVADKVRYVLDGPGELRGDTR